MKQNPIRRLTNDQSGATAIVVALMFTALFTMLAAAVDTSRLMLARNKLQSALDAAAIAAVREANTQNIAQEATKFFNANFPGGYMGMNPGTINVSVNGNVYTFTMTSNLPQALFPGVGFGGDGSNTITVTAQLVAGGGGGGGPGTEVVLILDNSASMKQAVTGSTKRIDILKAAIGNGQLNTLGIQPLLNRLEGKGAYISLVNFNDAVRIDPALSNSWRRTPSSNTKSELSHQSSSSPGRFDGCMATKYDETNTVYDSANRNNYLDNTDAFPTATNEKFRQYVGPVDFTNYTHPRIYANYTQIYSGYYRYDDNGSITTYDYNNETAKYGYDYLNGTYSSGNHVTPYDYGSIRVKDNFGYSYSYDASYKNKTYEYKRRYWYDDRDRGKEKEKDERKYSRYRTYYSYSSRYDMDYSWEVVPGFTAYAGEYQSHNPTGTPQQYDYIYIDAPSSSNYSDNMVLDFEYDYSYEQDYSYDDYRYVSAGNYRYTSMPKNSRTLSMGHSYGYAAKVYIGYKPSSHSNGSWIAYDENGNVLTTGTTYFTYTNSPKRNEKYVANIVMPAPFRPFASLKITYPRILPLSSACNSDYYYCTQYTNYTNNGYQGTSCYNGTCNDYKYYCTNTSCYSCTNGSCSSYNYGEGEVKYKFKSYAYAYGEVGPVIAYPTCGTLTKSTFMEQDIDTLKNKVANLEIGGPARPNIGLNWGWRALSPSWKGKFVPGNSAMPSDYNTGNTKVAVLVTQGESYDNLAKNRSTRSDTYDRASLETLCKSMKNKGIKLFVIGVDVDSSTTRNILKKCASDNQSFVDVASTSNGNINNLNSLLGRIADAVSSSGTGSLQFTK